MWIWRPQAEIGKAKIHLLSWFALSASSLALSTSDVVLSINVWRSCTTTRAFQALWEAWREPTGGGVVVSEHQRDRANSTSLSTFCTPRDRMVDWRSDVAQQTPRRQVVSVLQHDQFQVHGSSHGYWFVAIVYLMLTIIIWQISPPLVLYRASEGGNGQSMVSNAGCA